MPEQDAPDLVGLTAHLVTAYLRGTPLPASELADFILAAHAALVETQMPHAHPATPPGRSWQRKSA